MTQKELEIARKCIYSCETGGQVYGNVRYDCYVGKNTNSTKETACTIGGAGNHAGTAKQLMQMILEKYPSVFRANDTAGIENDLQKSWTNYDPGVGSTKAKCIQKIISTSEGIKCQDALLDSQILSRAEKVYALGVTNVDAQIFAAEIIHLGGMSAFERVLKKTSKPYTMDNIYNALKTDQSDTTSNNQVGDSKYWSRHKKIYGWLKEKITTSQTSKGESTTSVTEKTITICGHGSGNPSTKNLYTYNSQRYSSVASNGKRKGVVCVLRLKALTDANRAKFHDTYKTILGRNIYSQNLRSYVYSTYNGKYYSDCSSSICATFKKIGYSVSLLNTAGMYYSSLFEKIPVKISNGHITNPEILKVGDCLMYVGSDSSRPLQIGHVEAVYEISGSTSSTTTLKKGSTGTDVKTLQTMLIACGYTCGSAGADGDFGNGTLTALKAFQKDAGLEVDGLYGSASKTALTKEYADTEVVIRNAITWAITIAEDATHGYDQTNRWGPDYDCSSFVISAYESAGIKVKSAGATYTKNIETGFKKCGFKNVTSKVNLQTGKGAVIGDVFLKAGYHTALYLGNGKIAHASLNENGQITGGKTGDQASEIRIQQYFYDNWDTVLRYESTQESTSTVETANNISKGQKWLNDNYGELLKKACGGLLAVDGDYGTKTRNACLAVWKDVVNRKYGFSLTPSNTNFGDSCAKAAKKATIRKGASGTLPYILNMILYAKGYYTGDASATYSAKTKTAVVAFQKAKGLSTDSIVGAKTWTKLFN